MPELDYQSQDLSQALQTLQYSLYVLFLHYKGYFKLIFLSLFIYLFYKLGSLSVKDQVLNLKQQLSSLIEKRTSVKLHIPKKIQHIRKINKIVIFLTVLILLVYGFAHYSNYKPVMKYSSLILLALTILVITILTVLNLYKFYLNRKFRQTDTLERMISKKLIQFTTALGPKVNSILKHHLCKEKSLKFYSSAQANQCQKPDCKQLRGHYKARNQAVSSLTEEVINFEWCSVCKKRNSFDQYLPFQSKQYHNKAQNQQDQVKQRLNFLLQGIYHMRKWLNQTSPCNCSKLYWAASTKKIIDYKKVQKSTDSRIKELQTKHRN